VNNKAELPSARLRGKAVAKRQPNKSSYYHRKTCQGPDSDLIDNLRVNLHGWSRLGTKYPIIALSPQQPQYEQNDSVKALPGRFRNTWLRNH
jgi:hypothetical protein